MSTSTHRKERAELVQKADSLVEIAHRIAAIGGALSLMAEARMDGSSKHDTFSIAVHQLGFVIIDAAGSALDTADAMGTALKREAA